MYNIYKYNNKQLNFKLLSIQCVIFASVGNCLGTGNKLNQNCSACKDITSGSQGGRGLVELVGCMAISCNREPHCQHGQPVVNGGRGRGGGREGTIVVGLVALIALSKRWQIIKVRAYGRHCCHCHWHSHCHSCHTKRAAEERE